MFPMRVGDGKYFVAPSGREVMGAALGYGCRALRALPLRGFHKLPSWGTKRLVKVTLYFIPLFRVFKLT